MDFIKQTITTQNLTAKNIIMQNITKNEFFAKQENVLILPVGSTEQHGPHLPLGTDSFIAEDIAKILAQKTGGVVAPTLTYGYKSKPLSGGGPLFPGTIDLQGNTLTMLVYDILKEFIADGFLKIFILNAHFENEAFIVEAADIVSRECPDAVIIETNWWDVLSQEIIDEVFSDVPFPGWALEHAAVTETSLIMYLRPDLVHQELMADEQGVKPLPYYKYPIVKGMVPDSGVLSPANGSSKEKGKIMVDAAIKAFLEIIEKEFR